MYFNPLPPHGGRLPCGSERRSGYIFQSTPSAWRETNREHLYDKQLLFQSTPSAWRETLIVFLGIFEFIISIHSLRMEGDRILAILPPDIIISIHSLRMEGDVRSRFLLPQLQISIHSLRMEGDENRTLPSGAATIFQSTPSAWRETSSRLFNQLF